jgi:hypothetical protein
LRRRLPSIGPHWYRDYRTWSADVVGGLRPLNSTQFRGFQNINGMTRTPK